MPVTSREQCSVTGLFAGVFFRGVLCGLDASAALSAATSHCGVTVPAATSEGRWALRRARGWRVEFPEVLLADLACHAASTPTGLPNRNFVLSKSPCLESSNLGVVNHVYNCCLPFSVSRPSRTASTSAALALSARFTSSTRARYCASFAPFSTPPSLQGGRGRKKSDCHSVSTSKFEPVTVTALLFSVSAGVWTATDIRM